MNYAQLNEITLLFRRDLHNLAKNNHKKKAPVKVDIP